VSAAELQALHVPGALLLPNAWDAASKEVLAAAARIVRAVSVPVTVDAEAGYGMPPAELAERLADAGAAGCNVEDTDHAGQRHRPARRA
jgi:2-methylisocitrate lyase-like PEP mutase family enzyme